jgi:ABC-type multidrug transport system fused ATPase/permease subunit
VARAEWWQQRPSPPRQAAPARTQAPDLSWRDPATPALEAEVKTISSGLPLGVTLSKVTDQAVNITEAVDEFMLKFFVALGVVLVVTLLSLGWRVGIVVAATVPLTLAAVFEPPRRRHHLPHARRGIRYHFISLSDLRPAFGAPCARL